MRNDFVVYNLGGGHIAVGNVDELVVHGAEHGVEKSDAANGAAVAADVHKVVNLKGAGYEDGDAGEEICQQTLNCEGKCQTCNAEYGNKACYGNAQGVGNYDNCDCPQRNGENGAEEALETIVNMALVQHTRDGLFQNFDDYKADNKNYNCVEKTAQGHAAYLNLGE